MRPIYRGNWRLTRTSARSTPRTPFEIQELINSHSLRFVLTMVHSNVSIRRIGLDETEVFLSSLISPLVSFLVLSFFRGSAHERALPFACEPPPICVHADRA